MVGNEHAQILQPGVRQGVGFIADNDNVASLRNEFLKCTAHLGDQVRLEKSGNVAQFPQENTVETHQTCPRIGAINELVAIAVQIGLQ